MLKALRQETISMVSQPSIMESWEAPHNYQIDMFIYWVSLRDVIIRRAAFICNRHTRLLRRVLCTKQSSRANDKRGIPKQSLLPMEGVLHIFFILSRLRLGTAAPGFWTNSGPRAASFGNKVWGVFSFFAIF